jgi:hypothetical protein
VIVGLGTAVAMRARFSGCPAMAQEVNHRQHPARSSPRAKHSTGWFFKSIIGSYG